MGIWRAGLMGGGYSTRPTGGLMGGSLFGGRPMGGGLMGGGQPVVIHCV